MEGVILCEPRGSGDPLLSSTDLSQAVVYRDFCYTAPNLRNGDAFVDDAWFESAPYLGPGGQMSASCQR